MATVKKIASNYLTPDTSSSSTDPSHRRVEVHLYVEGNQEGHVRIDVGKPLTSFPRKVMSAAFKVLKGFFSYEAR